LKSPRTQSNSWIAPKGGTWRSAKASREQQDKAKQQYFRIWTVCFGLEALGIQAIAASILRFFRASGCSSDLFSTSLTMRIAAVPTSKHRISLTVALREMAC
jgi:hypothetical protein